MIDRDGEQLEVHISNPPDQFGFWKFFTLLISDCRFYLVLVMALVLLFAFFVVTDVLNPAILADIINAGIMEMEGGGP